MFYFEKTWHMCHMLLYIRRKTHRKYIVKVVLRVTKKKGNLCWCTRIKFRDYFTNCHETVWEGSMTDSIFFATFTCFCGWDRCLSRWIRPFWLSILIAPYHNSLSFKRTTKCDQYVLNDRHWVTVKNFAEAQCNSTGSAAVTSLLPLCLLFLWQLIEKYTQFTASRHKPYRWGPEIWQRID